MITHTRFIEELGRYREIHREAEEQADHLGLSASQWAVLNIINDFGTPFLNTISEVFGVTQPQITQLVNGLKSKGLVSVKPDKKDGRYKIASLTEKAKRLV